MNAANKSQGILRSYRDRAVGGGAIFGLFFGAIADGLNLSAWPAPNQMLNFICMTIILVVMIIMFQV